MGAKNSVLEELYKTEYFLNLRVSPLVRYLFVTKGKTITSVEKP